MGKIIPSILEQPLLDLGHHEVDQLFVEYGRRKDYASLESLGGFASSLATSFGDFLYRVGTNLKALGESFFKDFRRSELQVIVHANKVSIYMLFNSEYTELMNVECPVYPFELRPYSVASYCNSVFSLLSMNKRLIDITEEYMRLGASIRNKDEKAAVDALNKITVLNLKNNDSIKIKETLTNMVAGQSTKTKALFHDVFDASSEFKEAVEAALISANEFNTAMAVGKTVDILGKAYHKLDEAVSFAAKTPGSFDLSKISTVSGTIYETGELIESYAMLVREYHHLELWLSVVISNCLKAKKK